MASPFDDVDLPHDNSDAVVVDDFDALSGPKVASADDGDKHAPAFHNDDGFDMDGGDHHEANHMGDFGGGDSGAGHADMDAHDQFDHLNGDNHHNDPFAAASSEHNLDDGYEHSQKEPEDIFAQPTPLSLWEKDRKLVIEERIRNAQTAKFQAQQDAQQSINDFYNSRAEALQRTQAANRAEEKNTKADMEALMKGGTLWEKVGKLANLQPKANQDGKSARMRKLLIQLKNDKVDYDDKKKQ